MVKNVCLIPLFHIFCFNVPAPKMATPKLNESNSKVYKHGVLWLECPMEISKESNMKIYFTFNGTYPHCYYDTTMVRMIFS